MSLFWVSVIIKRILKHTKCAYKSCSHSIWSQRVTYSNRPKNKLFYFVSYLVIDVFRANLAPNNTSFLLPNKWKRKSKIPKMIRSQLPFLRRIIVYAIKPPINLRSHSFAIVVACILNGWLCWCRFNSIIFAHMKANIILHLFRIEHTDTHSSTHTRAHTLIGRCHSFNSLYTELKRNTEKINDLVIIILTGI